MPTLVLPSALYRESYLEALAGFQREGLNLEWDIETLAANFDILLTYLDNTARGIGLSGDQVPCTQFWLTEGREYIGRVNIRHRLTESLWLDGGHIGYQIRPDYRRRGYGSLILRLSLPEARRLGLKSVLVTCDPDNIASRKVIERCGGILEPLEELPTECRFRISVEEMEQQ